MIDFISTYMPAYAELTKDEVLAARGRLETFLTAGFPDMETSPASVTGDIIVTPQAYTIAALETGLERFMSDLDLANVADDVIYNCDFVERYLKNFSLGSMTSMVASGVVRLVFNANKEYTLDRSTRFSFSDKVFSMYMPFTGPFRILPCGTQELPSGENAAVLVDSGSDAYFVDIPVVGNSGVSEVTAGASALVNKEIPELGAATALVDFFNGSVEFTLPQLAKMARDTIYSASLNTRMGAIRYVNTFCPFTDSVYAIRNGDREMVRSYKTPGTRGCMDLYVRSMQYAFTEEQQLRLYYNPSTDKFEGEFPYTGQIYHFESITHPALPDVADIPHTITSTNGKGLGALAAYTVYEKLKIEVDNAVNENNDTIYNVSTDRDGRLYTTFKATYQTDPMFRAMSATVDNPDYLPVNASVLVRGFIPVIIDRFEVVYVKENGVVPLLDEARDRIKAYMSGLGAPNAYSDSEISRIMGEAGVKYVAGVNVRARVQWSVADKIEDFDGNIVSVPMLPSITTSAGLRVTYPASHSYDGSSMYACSPRNIRYYFMENSLSFKEIKEM